MDASVAGGEPGQGTTLEPMVGMKVHCLSVVVTWPKIVDMIEPDPVSTIAVSVVGPCGLISGLGLRWHCRTVRWSG